MTENNGLRLLQVAIRRTEQRLEQFERTYNLATDEFVRQFENDELEETLDFTDWIGEYRLVNRLREKAETLQGLEFAN